MNRLKNAIYQKPDMATAPTNSYNESAQYDKNGNITALQRNGNYDDAVTALQIDNLFYSYDNSDNQLTKVLDASNNPSGFKDDSPDGINDPINDYLYDANGNMVADQNKAITSIKYNHLNLPTEIIFNNLATKKITYLYDASGTKLQKTLTNGTAITITDYLDGFQYIKTGTAATSLKYFPTSEGYVSVTVSGGVSIYNYVFNYTDHLGNVRISYGYGATKSGVYGTYILQENNYYPFGLSHTNYNTDKLVYDQNMADGIFGTITLPSLNYPLNKYKFNNREWQDELGLNVTAMDYRQYDNAIGRFNSIDALSERAYDISPYRFALNIPNVWMDPSGLFETRKEAREYRKEHGISGRIVKQDDGTFSINDKKNSVSYSKGDDANFGNDTHANDGVIESALVYNTSKSSESNVVSTGKTINDYAGLGLAPVEFLPGSFRLGTANQAFSPKYYSNWTTGNQYTKVTTLSKLGKVMGYAGAGVGLILDAKGVKNYYDPKYGPNSPNSVHPGKAGLNTGMAAYGLWVNPIASILYSGIDTFYPGGWVGASETATRTENQEQKMTGHPFFSNSSMKF